MDSMNFYDGLAEPMADLFDLSQSGWRYRAIVPGVLYTTTLPLPRRTAANSLPLTKKVLQYAKPRHDAAYWEKKLGDQDFSEEDRLETDKVNRILWRGLMGRLPYPQDRNR
jgi:hypothetical protein